MGVENLLISPCCWLSDYNCCIVLTTCSAGVREKKQALEKYYTQLQQMAVTRRKGLVESKQLHE